MCLTFTWGKDVTANQNTYDNPAWGRPSDATSSAAPSSAPIWGPRGDGPLASAQAFLDGLPRPVAIGLMVLAFVFWWPVGLAALCYMIGSGRLGRRWRRDHMAAEMRGGAQRGMPWSAWAMGSGRGCSGSGNHAFDEYRDQTIQRLEQEQQEFGAFLERLRFAKDKAEFDQFMAERRGRPPAASSPPVTDGEQAAA